MRRRSLRNGLAAVSLALGLTLAPFAPAQAAPPKPVPAPTAAVATANLKAPDCQGAPTPAFQSTAPNTQLNGLFTRYGNDNSKVNDWTGADGTYSTQLPDGRLAFVFSDTFLGRADGGTRSPVISEGGTTPFLNNTFVVKDGDRLSTVTAGTANAPQSILPQRDATHWFWAGDAITAGGLVQTTYQEYEKFGPDIWDFRWHRNVLATFAPGNLSKPTSVTPLPSGQGVAWASWLEKVGDHIYIYGVEDLDGSKYMHLARVKGDRLTGQWEYRTAGGDWSTTEADSARIMSGVGNEYSVSKLGNAYVLITQDTTTAFSADIVAYFSCSPEGPFTGKTKIYTTPETGLWGSYENKDVYTYNAHAHPELSTGNRIVVSYNVNSLKNTDHYRDVSIYRPRFLDVTFR
ncbi:hypothetical protein GCM10010191_87160 [Actinomadura vinacea]|uniref:DUF4185 domain-containing protein n=1 Tax=Actinomadura vinacea TaxID=115336 RepID=A0ABN3KF50_9ACTN